LVCILAVFPAKEPNMAKDDNLSSSQVYLDLGI